MDNDDEWLSEEEEFQREQEAKLRAAAQQRSLAESESLSDDEPHEKQYDTRHKRSSPRSNERQNVSHRRDSEDSDWSDEDVGEGFTYRAVERNAPARRSINRASYSAEDYSSEEDLAMSSVSRQQLEPDHEEMGEC